MDIEKIKQEMMKHPEIFKNDLGDRKIEDLTEADFDFQGWLIPHRNLRYILENIGFKVDDETNRLYIDNNATILNTYPTIMHDDGMAYAAKTSKVVDVVLETKDDINIWTI